MSTETTAPELKAPPPQIGPTTTNPKGPRVKRQFSLASLLLFVLWVASAALIWLHWQSWVVTGDFPGRGAIFFSKDSRRILMQPTHEPSVIEVRTGEVIARPAFKTIWTGRSSFSANWEWLALKHEDEEDKICQIEIYDYRNGELEQAIECGMYDRMFHLSEDGERLFFNKIDGSLWVYRRKHDKPDWKIPFLRESEKQEGDASPPVPVSAEDAKRLQACERAVLDARTMDDLQAAVENLDRIPHDSSWICTDLNPYADLAVTRVIAKDANKTCTWDLSSGRKIVELEGYDANQYANPVFCKDGRTVGAVDKEHAKVAVWDLNTGRMSASWNVSDAPLEDEGTLILAPEGRAAVLQLGQSHRLWECSTGRLVAELPSLKPFGNWDFSADGKRLVGAPANEELLIILDAENGARLCTLPSPGGRCGVTLQYAPDGNSLVATGNDAFLVGTKLYLRHHSEGDFGVLTLPELWVFIALTLLQLWRILRWVRGVRPT